MRLLVLAVRILGGVAAIAVIVAGLLTVQTPNNESVQAQVEATAELTFVVPLNWACIPLTAFSENGTSYEVQNWPEPFEEGQGIVFTVGLQQFYTSTCHEGAGGLYLPDDPDLGFVGE